MPSASRLRRAAAGLVAAAVLALTGPAVAAPDMKKVIRDVFPVAETGFDPAAVHDLYSATVIQALFETLLTYDYLAQPAKLVPRAAESMPVVTDDGRTWTIKVRPGIRFAPDPVFRPFVKYSPQNRSSPTISVAARLASLRRS